jgi:hypothetical protein
MVHADLEHAEPGGLRHQRERQRYAPVIVVGGGRRMRLPLPAEDEPQRLLGSGLADRTGDRHDLRGRTRARFLGEIVQRREHVRHEEQRRVLRHRVSLAFRRDRKAGAGFQRSLDEFVAVAVLALDREKGFAWPDRARVDRKPRHCARKRACASGSHRGRHGVGSPERLAHATFSFSAAATASWSLNGSTASPTIWPLS